jgi:hypothetical protein
MRVAEVFVPAVVIALLGGPTGALYLICVGVSKVRRRALRSPGGLRSQQ